MDPKPISLSQVDAGDYDSPFAPEPMVVVGDIPAGDAPAFEDIPGTVDDATGANLQAILEGLTARIEALEAAAE